MSDQEAPVKAGELYDVSIQSVGGKGDGIAKVRGFVLFVANTKKGDYVKVKITKVLTNAGFAEVVEKLVRPTRESKFATMSAEEFHEPEDDLSEKYEESEDFGEELDDED
ncbi:TRAM domain-containing protein [Candidatus Woesearchaeota archaeon]|nr:TRAM domain-containing protein [Candidatus Woesearchaeota archaeon]